MTIFNRCTSCGRLHGDDPDDFDRPLENSICNACLRHPLDDGRLSPKWLAVPALALFLFAGLFLLWRVGS